MANDKKPAFYLAGGKGGITAAHIAALYEKMTGKKMSPEGLARAEKELAAKKK